MERMTITLPEKLKSRMALMTGSHNWSALCVKGFEEYLDFNPEYVMECKTRAQLINKLRSQKNNLDNDDYGRGFCWAKAFACSGNLSYPCMRWIAKYSGPMSKLQEAYYDSSDTSDTAFMGYDYGGFNPDPDLSNDKFIEGLVDGISEFFASVEAEI